jgi:hypothetical protein
MSQQFVAVGADAYGNRITGLDVTWKLDDSAAGRLTENGYFTAGKSPGVYERTVIAEVGLEDEAVSAGATVTVEPDKVSYVRDDLLYVVEIGGAERAIHRIPAKEDFRIYYGGRGEYRGYVWSLDGRRVLSWQSEKLVVTNEDGALSFLYHLQPEDFTAWGRLAEISDLNLSPDGSRLAFVALNTSGSSHDRSSQEIFTIHLQTGDEDRLTNTQYSTEREPEWSPDGEEIIYTSLSFEDPRYGIYGIYIDKRLVYQGSSHPTSPSFSPNGSEILVALGDKIVIMAPDWTNMQVEGDGTDPVFTPDGKFIAFVCCPNKHPNEEIFIKELGSSKKQQLTDNSDREYQLRWVPRKSGIPINEQSIIIPRTVPVKYQSSEKNIERISQAIVKVSTNAGSFSGIIIDSKGLILAGAEALVGAEDISVSYKAGGEETQYSAHLIGYDLARGLAVLRIDTNAELPTVPLGDFSTIAPGTAIKSVGFSPDNGGLTVIDGKVSTIKTDSARGVTWFQTDIPPDSGPIGSPIIDPQGQVIGIITAKRDSEHPNEAPYAISIDALSANLNRLLSGNNVHI